MPEENKPSADPKVMAALSYLWILSIAIYVIEKDDEYVQFHAKQGMIIFALSLLSFVPIIGWALAPLITIAILVLIVLGAAKAYMGEKYQIPFIYNLSTKINF